MNKFWEDFLNSNEDIKKKLNGLPLSDPIVEMVDAAIQEWTSKKRDAQFSFTPENRELLIKMVKTASRYHDIVNSPFYQYIRAYELYLYRWLVDFEKQAVAAGDKERVDWMYVFETIMANALVLGYCIRVIEPPKRKRYAK